MIGRFELKSVALWAVLIATIPLACRETIEVPVAPAEETTEEPAQVTEEVTDLSETTTSIEAEVGEAAEVILLDTASLGTPSGDGVDESSSFSTSQTITLLVRVREVPEGLVARARWLDSAGEALSEQQVDVPQSRSVRFAMPENLRNPGSYSVEAYLGGNLVDQFEFEIE
ncbi:MAG: hypothetical protein KY459_06260 [Acidobacteria bacterium]|nr:hypothetical protein [Acidobacteriota bacterium]